MLRLPGQQAVERRSYGVSRRAGMAALALFAVLLAGLPVLAAVTASPVLATLDAFYRAGALVFGGGHVVLPLLQSAVVPGGAVMRPEVAGIGGWVGGLTCLLAIFLPAWLLVVDALPFWDTLRQRPAVQSALAGVNAGVVGILLAALYDPVWTSAISSRADFALALGAFGLLVHALVAAVCGGPGGGGRLVDDGDLRPAPSGAMPEDAAPWRVAVPITVT
jgi:chromate transporter